MRDRDHQLVARATAAAGGADRGRDPRRSTGLQRKVRRYRPRALAIVGIGAYRIAFDRPRAGFGRQPEDLAGALFWVLPNTSGLNAHYQAAGSPAPSRSLRAAPHLGEEPAG